MGLFAGKEVQGKLEIIKFLLNTEFDSSKLMMSLD